MALRHDSVVPVNRSEIGTTTFEVQKCLSISGLVSEAEYLRTLICVLLVVREGELWLTGKADIWPGSQCDWRRCV